MYTSLLLPQLDHVSTKLQGAPSLSTDDDRDCVRTRLFPQLEEVFELTDQRLGFAVELKYPIRMKESIASTRDAQCFCNTFSVCFVFYLCPMTFDWVYF